MTSSDIVPIPELITTPSGLHEFLHRMEPLIAGGKRPKAALDLEADSFHNYREKICLFQVSVEGEIALFDPLEGLDLRPLLRLLDETELWFHGGDYDLSLLIKTYDWTPKDYYDTQIAARLCGQKHFGLAALAAHYLGIEMPKHGQRADWSRRPLTPSLLHYGAQDVKSTLGLAGILVEQLNQMGRMSWFRESCDAALRAARERPERSREDIWRINGSGKLTPRQLEILRCAWIWRDREAERRDRPHFKVVNNDALLAYVAYCDQTNEVTHVPKGVRGDAASALQLAARDALDRPPSSWPTNRLERKRRMNRPDERDVNRLRDVRDLAASRLDIDSSLIATRGLLEDLVVHPSQGRALLQNWQFAIFSEALHDLAEAVKHSTGSTHGD